MSFAFLPLFTGDYLKKTRHLTPQKHGVYLLLLIHCWDTKGPLPLDEQECAGIANCRSADEIDSLRYILGKFFIHMEDGWYNERCQQEIEKSQAIASKRATAGKIGGTVRAKHLKEKKNEASANQKLANAKQVSLTPTLTLTPTITGNDSQASLGVAIPPCPVLRIRATYNEICKLCTRSQVPTATLQAHISARWRQIFADGAADDYDDAAEFFREFFTRVQASRFLTGRAKARDGGKPFRASLRWLMKPENFAKTIEGEYDDELHRQA